MSRDDVTDAPAGRSVVVECPLEAPPDRVWRAVTEPELVARWIVPETGGAGIRYERLSAEPRRRVRYRWREEAPDGSGAALDSVVTFELTPAGTGTHLRVVHEELAAKPAEVVSLRRRRPAAPGSGGTLAMAA